MACRKPCKSCPWRLDSKVEDIPRFSMEMADNLERTVDGQPFTPMMACHQSTGEMQFVCAGWLAVHGEGSTTVRMVMAGIIGDVEGAVLKGIEPAALSPGEDWPEMHVDIFEMNRKLRAQLEALDG